MSVSAVVFDFDNVIALLPDGTGSEEIKDAVWPEVFGDAWGSIKDTFPDILRKNAGGNGSRFTVIREALIQLAFQGNFEEEVQRRAEVFNRRVLEGITGMGVPSETKVFLEKLSSRLPIFINSATPLAPLQGLLRGFGILTFFTEVYGQEIGKTEGLRCALKQVGETDPQKILFVGDAVTDYEASQTVGTLFVGVATKRNGWREKSQAFPVVSAVYKITV